MSSANKNMYMQASSGCVLDVSGDVKWYYCKQCIAYWTRKQHSSVLIHKCVQPWQQNFNVYGNVIEILTDRVGSVS